MENEIEIRAARTSDLDSLLQLYPDAFPEEDLLSLVEDLHRSREDAVISLVAIAGHRLVGHIAFTLGGIDGGPANMALLAPLAVASAMQKQGFGKALVAEGLGRLKARSVARVLVLGDPRYYGRFGFETEKRIEPPYPLPAEWQDAWQSLILEETRPARGGALKLPAFWMRPALWAP